MVSYSNISDLSFKDAKHDEIYNRSNVLLLNLDVIRLRLLGAFIEFCWLSLSLLLILDALERRGSACRIQLLERLSHPFVRHSADLHLNHLLAILVKVVFFYRGFVLLIVLHHADGLLHNKNALLIKSYPLSLLLSLSRDLIKLFLQVLVLFTLLADIILQLLVVFVDLGGCVLLNILHFLNQVLHENVDLRAQLLGFSLKGCKKLITKYHLLLNILECFVNCVRWLVI